MAANFQLSDREEAISLHSDVYKERYRIRPRRNWDGVATEAIWAAARGLLDRNAEALARAAEYEVEDAEWQAAQEAERAAEMASDAAFNAWLADHQAERDARSDRLEAQAANWG